ncbi:MAG: tagaturonate reductase [Anaerolineae bacterium]|nr:tagaturonate reductase [Anaerolineae bacterium]
MPPLNRQTAQTPAPAPERIVQFGGGNFLRGFVDWIVEQLNRQTDFASSVVIVKPTPHGSYAALDAQEGLFHVRLTGGAADNPVMQTALVTCVRRTVNPYTDYAAYLSLARQPGLRFIVSNTTESGIVYDPAVRLADQPSESFPAKLAAFLYERYQHFGGDRASGCIVLPCELIERNGEQLKALIVKYADRWQLEPGFTGWLDHSCLFCNTLVDRIVSGFPPGDSAATFAALGYTDQLLVEGEVYHSWIIEAPVWLERELPFHLTDLNVKIVDDVRPYHALKVRILNGAHTSLALLGLLLGLETVREAVEHPLLGPFIRDLVFADIVPTLTVPEAPQFAEAVLARFRNPFLHHRLANIAQNSLSKFRTRLLPTLSAAALRGESPERLALVFAALIRFYGGAWPGGALPVNDDPARVAWLSQVWASGVSARDLTAQVLAHQDLWGADLTTFPQLVDRVSAQLARLDTQPLDQLVREHGH